MKTHIFLILLFPFLLPSNTYSQERTTEKKQTRRRIAKADAITQIQQLHDGALLVRLQTRKLAISQLVERGELERAERIKAERKQINLHIIKAFRQKLHLLSRLFFLHRSINGD